MPATKFLLPSPSPLTTATKHPLMGQSLKVLFFPLPTLLCPVLTTLPARFGNWCHQLQKVLLLWRATMAPFLGKCKCAAALLRIPPDSSAVPCNFVGKLPVVLVVSNRTRCCQASLRFSSRMTHGPENEVDNWGRAKSPNPWNLSRLLFQRN